MLNRTTRWLPLLFPLFAYACTKTDEPTRDTGTSNGTNDAAPQSDATNGDAVAAGDAAPNEDAGIVPPATPEEVALSSEAAAQSAMVSSAIAAVIAEVAADEYAGPRLGFRQVLQGDLRDRPASPGVDGRTECIGAAVEHLDRCPAVITCGDRTILAFGEGCATPSGRRIAGVIRIIGGTWRFGGDLAPLSIEGDSGRITVRGTLNATNDGSSITFNQRVTPLIARLPTGPRLARDREIRVKLEDIRIAQSNDGFVVSGPDTFVIEDLVIDCDGTPTMIDLTVEDCGGWGWEAPLTSCMCPSSGELRVIGPLLDPCGSPTSLQTMVVTFSSVAASSCGENLGATLYAPSTQCESSCGACDPGTCFRGLCTASVDVSALASSMVGWICELPQTACASLEEAGISCSTDGSISVDGALGDRDGGAPRDGDLRLDGSNDVRDGSGLPDALPFDANISVDGSIRPDADLSFDADFSFDGSFRRDANSFDGSVLADGGLLSDIRRRD